MTASIARIDLTVDELQRATQIYSTLSGGDVRHDIAGPTVTIAFGEATLVLAASSSPSLHTVGRAGEDDLPRPGISVITVVVDDFDSCSARLGAVGLVHDPSADRITLRVHGVSVTVVRSSPTAATQTTEPAADIDHVALAVLDLDAASTIWEAITGQTVHQMGLHPISNGAFRAARVVLGERMIELLSPSPGVDSPMAARVQRHGEHPIALAIPARHLDRTLEELEAIGVRPIRQNPHWMIHPRDTGGVLVQLTPRVLH